MLLTDTAEHTDKVLHIEGNQNQNLVTEYDEDVVYII